MAGKFYPIGGAWVEHDANMPSGEALVRQMLYGQRYFESRFGLRCETGWLPDSFGLTGALPQIMRSCGEYLSQDHLTVFLSCNYQGMKYFFTQKLSWYVNISFTYDYCSSPCVRNNMYARLPLDKRRLLTGQQKSISAFDVQLGWH